MATHTAMFVPTVATPGSLAAPDCDPWSSLAWTNLWWRCLDQRRRLVPLTLPGSPRLVLPLVASCWRGLRRLQGAGSDSQRRDLACPPAAWPELAAHFVAAGGWDWLDLNLMPEATAHGWGRALAEHGCRVAITASGRQRYLPLRRPWPLVEQDWSAALRHRLPREERALLRRGAHLETVTAPAAAAAAFERCLAIEASGWKGRQGTAMLSRPPVADFYRQLLRQLAEQQRLRLYLLRCLDEVVAFDLTVATPRGLAGLKVGMAESWKKWTPGMVLQLWVLRAAHAGGWGEYDFLGGDEPHKAEWTPHFRALCRLQAFAPTWRGRALALGRERRQRWRSQPHLQPV